MHKVKQRCSHIETLCVLCIYYKEMRCLVAAVLFYLLTFNISLQHIYAQDFASFYDLLVGIFEPYQDENTGLTTMASLKIPIGGEHAAMATANTALAQDISFMESNPAGSAILKETELGIFHRDLIDIASLDGVMYTRRWNNLGMGAGAKIIHVPFEGIDASGRETGGGRYIESVGGVNIAYNAFSGFYFHGISIGANLKYALRVVPEIIAPGQSAATALIDVGMLTRFNFLKFFSARERNFSLGLVIKNIGPDAKAEPLPSLIQGGIAYAPIRPLTIAADYIYPIQLFSDIPAERPGFAVGIRANITPFLRMNGGFSLQGGAPRLVIGNQIDMGDVRFAASYTLDYTTQFTHPNNFSVTASLNLGDQGRGALQRQTENLYLEGLIAFSEGELELTMALTSQALALNPRFDPARELLQLADESLQLQREMESLETLGDS